MLSMKQKFEDVSETNNEYIIKRKFLELIGILIQYYNQKEKKKKQSRKSTLKRLKIQRRIDTSLNYLNNTQKKMTILEIATICRFNNTVNFNKCFKLKLFIFNITCAPKASSLRGAYILYDNPERISNDIFMSDNIS